MNVDQGIEDVMDHFAIEPKKCLANPSDVPVFLSVRIVDDDVLATTNSGGTGTTSNTNGGTIHTDVNDKDNMIQDQMEKNPIEHVFQYEKDAAGFAREFEESMVRF